VPNPERNFLANVLLTEDPRTGWIIGLKDDGILFAVDTGLTVRFLANLKAINWDESAIYDVQTGQVRAIPISPGQTNFGRVYAIQTGTTTELWITANSVITPFAMKLTVDLAAQKFTQPKVVVMSSVTTAPNVEPAGIAVGGGVVLTFRGNSASWGLPHEYPTPRETG
jgi:hypothetical protein